MALAPQIQSLVVPLDRLSRHKYALWRQVAQILFALDALNRRTPQRRRLHRYARAGGALDGDQSFDD